MLGKYTLGMEVSHKIKWGCSEMGQTVAVVIQTQEFVLFRYQKFSRMTAQSV